MIAIQWEDVIGVLQTCRPYLIALGVLWIAAVIIMIACRKVKKKSKKRIIRKYSALSMLTAETDVEGTTETYPYYTNRMPSYYSGLIRQVGDGEFKELLGYPIPSGKWSGDLTVNDAICQMYYAKSSIARFVYRKLTKMKKKSEDAGKPDLNILFIYNMPFRAIAKMTGGMVSMEMVEGIVTMVNGHLFRGLGHTIAGFFRNQRQNRKYVKQITGKKN